MAMFNDIAGTVQQVQGTVENDVFRIHASYADYHWGLNPDGQRIVVWTGSHYDILSDIEVIRFDDLLVRRTRDGFVTEVPEPLPEGENFQYEPGITNLVQGTPGGDSFVIDAASAGWRWQLVNDNMLVVWGGGGNAILTDIENVIFRDLRLEVMGGEVISHAIVEVVPQIFTDAVGVNENLSGGESDVDQFLINDTSDGYQWATASDGRALVVWKGNEFAVLHDIEQVVFNDITLQFDAGAFSTVDNPDYVADPMIWFDQPGVSERLTGSASTADEFIFDDSHIGYQWVRASDGKVVIWKGSEYAMLKDIEFVRFHDAELQIRDDTVELIVYEQAPVYPEPNDDSADTSVGLPISIDVLGNDSDPEGQWLTIVDYTQPAHGELILGINNDFVYVPDQGYEGVDTFQYTIENEDGLQASAMVVVNVVGTGHEIFAQDDYDSVPAGEPVSIDVLHNDRDPDGAALYVSGFTQPANGSVTMEEDGLLTYTPYGGFVGTDTFTYDVMIEGDPFAVDTATVTIVVADYSPPPDVIDDEAQTSFETPVVINVLANDSDRNGDPLFVSDVQQPSNGQVELLADGRLRYSPDTGFEGMDSFTYQVVNDATGAYDSGTVIVEVMPAPYEWSVQDDAYSVPAGGYLVFDPTENDVNPEGGAVTLVSFGSPANGYLGQRSDGQLIYVPKPDFVGIDSFEYTVLNARGKEETGTVTVQVKGEVPPSLQDDVFQYSLYEGRDFYLDVLANDVDPYGGELTLVDVSQPAHAQVVIVGNQLLISSDGWEGEQTFSYTVRDSMGDTQTANVTFGQYGESLTVAQNDEFVVSGAQASVLDVLANDSNANGDPLVIREIIIPPDHGIAEIGANGELLYTPEPGFVGVDRLSYVAAADQPLAQEAVASVSILVTGDGSVRLFDATGSETVQGTDGALDVFVIDDVSTAYSWTANGDTVVYVSNDIDYAVLQGVEQIQFVDRTVTYLGNGEFRETLTANPSLNVIGTADDDILSGGEGDDVQSGLAGADVFVASHGNDVVTDLLFSEGDSLDFSAILPNVTDDAGFDAAVRLVQDGENAIVTAKTFSEYAVVTLEGVDLSAYESASELVGAGHFSY